MTCRRRKRCAESPRPCSLPWVSDDGHPLSTSERLLELLPNVQIHVVYHLRDVGTWTDRIEAFLGRLTTVERS